MSATYETDPAEKYLALDWDWSFREVVEDGESYWEAAIAEIPDFSAFGDDATEVAFNAREALLSHLRGYLVSGKRIPVPGKVRHASYEPNRAALAGR